MGQTSNMKVMKKVLIIEDNINIRKNIAEILKQAGYHVVFAENGKIGTYLSRAGLLNDALSNLCDYADYRARQLWFALYSSKKKLN